MSKILLIAEHIEGQLNSGVAKAMDLMVTISRTCHAESSFSRFHKILCVFIGFLWPSTKTTLICKNMGQCVSDAHQAQAKLLLTKAY